MTTGPWVGQFSSLQSLGVTSIFIIIKDFGCGYNCSRRCVVVDFNLLFVPDIFENEESYKPLSWMDNIIAECLGDNFTGP